VLVVGFAAQRMQALWRGTLVNLAVASLHLRSTHIRHNMFARQRRNHKGLQKWRGKRHSRWCEALSFDPEVNDTADDLTTAAQDTGSTEGQKRCYKFILVLPGISAQYFSLLQQMLLVQYLDKLASDTCYVTNTQRHSSNQSTKAKCRFVSVLRNAQECARLHVHDMATLREHVQASSKPFLATTHPNLSFEPIRISQSVSQSSRLLVAYTGHMPSRCKNMSAPPK
jgi:hypothetical protein